MSEEPFSRGPDSTDQLLEEASHWFARMRGPDAETSRADFERWLALGAAHRGAYNRAGEIFAMGRFLAHERRAAASAQVTHLSDTRRLGPLHWAVAAGVVAAIGLGSWTLLPHHGPSPRQQTATTDVGGDIAHAAISTVGTGRRVTKLADGSIVTLDADTMLVTAFSTASRELTLQRGHARFDVAHEARPFVVRAGGGSVIARGTIFDISVSRQGEVTVRLLRGAVDVKRPHTAANAASSVTRLGVGEVLSFGLGKTSELATGMAGHGPPYPDISDLSTIREFDRTPLASVLATANRDSVMQIRLSEPSLAALKVSGRFRVDDAEQVAERLAALFDLQLEHTTADLITLRSANQP